MSAQDHGDVAGDRLTLRTSRRTRPAAPRRPSRRAAGDGIEHLGHCWLLSIARPTVGRGMTMWRRAGYGPATKPALSPSDRLSTGTCTANGSPSAIVPSLRICARSPPLWARARRRCLCSGDLTSDTQGSQRPAPRSRTSPTWNSRPTRSFSATPRVTRLRRLSASSTLEPAVEAEVLDHLALDQRQLGHLATRDGARPRSAPFPLK